MDNKELLLFLLTCCVLYEKIFQHQFDLDNTEYLSRECKEWLAEEIEETKESLFSCTTGILHTSRAKKGGF